MVAGPSEFLRAFLHESISSYEELEALLLLARASDRSWTQSEVAEALKATPDSLELALSNLAAVDGLLQVASQGGARRFRYAPKSKLLRQVVDELLVSYAEQRLAIVQLMSANALERVRGAAMRRLADAFRVERPKK